MLREWLALDEPTQLTLLQLQRSGVPQPVFERRPSLFPSLAWVYDDYWKIDRDMNGLPTFQGMRQVLDERGIAERGIRGWLISLWLSMRSEEAKANREKK